MAEYVTATLCRLEDILKVIVRMESESDGIEDAIEFTVVL